MFKKTLLGITLLSILTIMALAVPNQLTYSGRLLQNGALVNSTALMDFKIYSDLTAGTLLWQAGAGNVEVNQGIYSVVLGSTSNPISPNIFVTENAYLEVTVGGEVLSPRTRINSVGYALQAGGLSNGGIQAAFVSTNGNIGFGTTMPYTKIDVYPGTDGLGGAVRGLIRPATSSRNALYNSSEMVSGFRGEAAGLIYTGFNGYQFPFNSYGEMIIQANARTGGYNNGISFATGTTVPTISIRIDPNGNLGIGTTAPNTKLEISQATGATQLEAIRMTATDASADSQGHIISWRGPSAYNYDMARIVGSREAMTSGGHLKLYTGAGTYQGIDIDSAGRVGIGTISPAGKLNVVGDGTVGSGAYYFDVYHSGTSYPNLYFRKSESNTIGTLAQTSDAWGLGGVFFQGVNTSGTRASGAAIYAGQSGAAGASAVPTKLFFTTSDAAGNASKVVIDPAGNVGINTSAPGYKLQIDSDPSSTLTKRVILLRNPAARGAGGGLEIHAAMGDWDLGNIRFMADGISGTGAVRLDLLGGVSDTTGLHVLEGGNVGVGSTRPLYKFQVNGGSIALGPNGANTVHTIGNARFDGGTDNRAAINFITNASNDEYITFDVLDSGVNGYPGAMAIDYNGNVGVGTTTPRAKFDVNGSAGNTTGVWSTLSDVRLKKDIRPLQNSLDTLLKLQGVSFHWKDAQKDKTAGLQR
ncbi:MAG: tail fiber domain-containing protein, partial [Candidatus Margulisiibacteriota bacterium]